MHFPANHWFALFAIDREVEIAAYRHLHRCFAVGTLNSDRDQELFVP
jgi:hypothetical protein